MLLNPRAFSAVVAAESVLPTTLGTAAVAGPEGEPPLGEVGEVGEVEADLECCAWPAVGGARAELAGAWVAGSLFFGAAAGDLGPEDGEDAEVEGEPAGGVDDAVLICCCPRELRSATPPAAEPATSTATSAAQAMRPHLVRGGRPCPAPEDAGRSCFPGPAGSPGPPGSAAAAARAATPAKPSGSARPAGWARLADSAASGTAAASVGVQAILGP